MVIFCESDTSFLMHFLALWLSICFINLQCGRQESYLPGGHLALGCTMQGNGISLLFVLSMMFMRATCKFYTFPSKMIHKYSDEAKAIWTQKQGQAPMFWPTKGSSRYYQMLHKHDNQRHRRTLTAEYQSLYFSPGNETVGLGETFGWLHYTWVDIGTPNVSFLVALDTGSDLFWVPCNCIQCAPTSAPNYGLDRDLSVYSPAASSTSKHFPCSNKLCELQHKCKDMKQICPYKVKYLSNDTSTSGVLMEDVIHLAPGNELTSGGSVKVPVIIGCGQVQSGGFLDGGAPDGLLGLGFGDVSVPSLLAKAGMVQNSFSMCFQPDDSGTIFFGNNGASNQQTTPFLPHNGMYSAYMVGVEGITIGSAAIKISGFKALIDSGTSFTYLPSDVYHGVIVEFEAQVKYPKAIYEDLPWDCYEVRSSDVLEVPVVSLVFKGGGNFSVYSPIIELPSGNGTLEGFCLAIQEGSFGIIGQNFMTSYQLVFDRENLSLGWSPSDCYQMEQPKHVASPASPPQETLRTPMPSAVGQLNHSSSHAVSPAIAGRTPRLQHHSDSLQRKPNITFYLIIFYPVMSFMCRPWYTFLH